MFKLINFPRYCIKNHTKYTSIANVSNFKRPMTLKLEDINSRILADVVNSSSKEQDWQKVRTQIIGNDRSINAINVDSHIIGYCIKNQNLASGKSYIQFLKDQGFQINYATLGRLLKLYHDHCFQKGTKEEDEQEILNIAHKILSEHPILDASTSENLILALCVTKDWKRSLELLDMIKITCNPTASSYSAIISKSFSIADTNSTEEVDLGWRLLNEMVIARKLPKCSVYISWINLCTKKVDGIKMLENMLDFIGHHNLIISNEVVNKLTTIFNRLGYTCNQSKVNRRGKCSACSSYLDSVEISDLEFKTLATNFMDKALIKKDAYLKSSPDEVSRFQEFVDKTVPYDCVIDGLNVAFSAGSPKNTGTGAKILASVVRHFVDKGEHVLVLGRKHMNRWPNEQMNYIRKKCTLFLTENISQDDPFLLYAALKSGKNTNFFSRDLMRGHSFLLNNKDRETFLRWQQVHQYSLIHASDAGKVIIKNPIEFKCCAHKKGSSWHIPFQLEYLNSQPATFEVPPSWLCISKRKL